MKKQSQNRAVSAYYINHVKQYPRWAIGSLVSLPLATVINQYLPTLLLAGVLNRLSQHHYTSNLWDSFGPTLVAYAVLLLAGIVAWRLNDFFLWRLEAKVQRAIGRQVYEHLLNESADFHANNFSGSLVSQTSKIIGGYARTADTTNYQVLPLFTALITTLVILGFKAPLYDALLLTFTVLFIAIAGRLSKPTQLLSTKVSQNESKQTGVLADAVTNIMTIKSFARGSYEKRRFAEVTDTTHDSFIHLAKAMMKQFTKLNLISRTMSLATLLLAVASVVVFHAEIGTAFLIFNYTSDVVDKLFTFSNNGLRNYNRAFGDASDMVAILAQQPAILDPAKPKALSVRKGSVTFNKVTFAHDGANDAIFDNFSLDIQQGEKIGLVGHSGSGKTTFTRLLMRFSDITSGTITIDGQNIAEVSQDDLHSVIAYVPQEPLLFHRSIKENISYGKLDATEDEIVAAARKANAAEFIEELPKGYETLVGERGVKLSGGQRQRVTIARAMLKNAPILLLDEATSALDSESEKLIQDALWKLMEGKTAVVIAHRLSTIQKMDRIVVLDNGAIIEQGSHKELLAKKGAYAKLWAHQSGGFIEE